MQNTRPTGATDESWEVEISFGGQGSTSTLHLAGALVSSTRGTVLDALTVLLAERPARLIIDLREIHTCDDPDVITYMAQAVRDAGASVKWVGLDHVGTRRRVPPWRLALQRRSEARSSGSEMLDYLEQ